MAGNNDPMGLANAYGAGGAADTLRQLIIDKFTRQMQEQQAALQERHMALLEQQAKQQAEDRAAALAEKVQAERDAAAGKSAPLVGMGGNISFPQFAKTYAGTSSEQLFEPQVSLGARTTVGGQTLPNVPSSQSGDAGTSQIAEQTTQQAPRSYTGRLVMTGTPAQKDQAKQQSDEESLLNDANVPDAVKAYIKATRARPGDKNMAYQLFAPPEKTVGEGSYVLPGVGPIIGQKKPNGTILYQGRDVTGLVKPYAPPQQPVVIQTDSGFQLADRGKGTATPLKDAQGNQLKSKESGTMETRLASAKAVTQTGTDMINALSDPTLAAQLGPAMGRYNSLADFVGNPPPEFAKLAGQIESYSLANMGVHGMRANTGAEAIKATLGTGRHTPATIIAIIQGLNGFANHLLENEGRGASATTAGGNDPLGIRK